MLEDLANSPLKPPDLAKVIHTEQPLAIGFTAYQQNIEQIRLWARFAKKVSPSSKIILGPSCQPRLSGICRRSISCAGGKERK
jgi:hypothetical protein